MSLVTDVRTRHSSRNRGPVAATLLFARRTFYHMRNNGFGMAMETILSPIIMLLIFAFLFGGAISGSVQSYISYLLPGMLILTVVPLTVYTGTTLCTDIAKGVYSRFRTIPFWQPAAVLGSVTAEGLRYSAALISVLAAGMALGFRPEGGTAGAVQALLYALFFAYCVSWVFALIGNVAKRPETVSGTSMMAMYPLLFASNVLVDTSSMPGWLGTTIDWNPVSIAVRLVRGLLHGTATAADLAAGIGLPLLLAALFAPMTMSVYQAQARTKSK
ncbi:ABC transporter permease [Cohnella hongkongensis]|uniref:Transport permease protein n=1 Tax=Cohnella hongkongensis TaxID=178337 RepID=A0ABV9F8S3_9BACL